MMSAAAIDAMQEKKAYRQEALKKIEGFADRTTGNGTEQILEISFGLTRI